MKAKELTLVNELQKRFGQDFIKVTHDFAWPKKGKYIYSGDEDTTEAIHIGAIGFVYHIVAWKDSQWIYLAYKIIKPVGHEINASYEWVEVAVSHKLKKLLRRAINDAAYWQSHDI